MANTTQTVFVTGASGYIAVRFTSRLLLGLTRVNFVVSVCFEAVVCVHGLIFLRVCFCVCVAVCVLCAGVNVWMSW